MTEQEYINKLIEIGYTGDELKSICEVTKKMKNINTNMTYEELIPFAKEAYDSTQDEPENTIRLD